MSSPQKYTRRALLRTAGAGAAGALAVAGLKAAEPIKSPPPRPRGNIKQSVCRWCYGRIPLPKLAEAVKKMGYQSIELLTPEQFKEIKPFGLTCAILGGASIADGLNRKENHAPIEKQLRRSIDFAAAEGIPNVICMSGNRRGMGDDEGVANCASGVKRVLAYAEEKKVTLCMEGLNSKVDHKDYMVRRVTA